MALMICPECGKDCSTAALECPNCGHPFKPVAAPPAQRVVVREIPEKKEFPKWIFIPLAILGAVLIFFLFLLINRDDETANRNINVKLNPTSTPITQSTVATTTTTTTVPGTTTTAPVVIPQTTVPTTTTTTTVPAGDASTVTTAPPVDDKGTVNLEAKIFTKNGSQQAVSSERFYLLDRDLQSILSEANIPDPEGQGAVTAFALSVMNPSKYPEVRQKALAAIEKHIVYRTTTDGGGKGAIKDIKPDSYYLFGIKTTKTGFAIWDNPVTIQAGQNNLVLEPKTPTEVVTGISQ